MSARARAVTAVLAALLLVAPVRDAHAEPIPLSRLPLASDDVPKAPGTERMTDVRNTDDWFVTALDQPVCIDGGGGGALMALSDSLPPDSLEIERLELGEHPVMDRIVIDARSKLPLAHVLRRSRTPLLLVLDGAMRVYAYRTKTIIGVVVPRGFTHANEAFVPVRMWGMLRERCGFERLELPIGGGFRFTHLHPPDAAPLSDPWRCVFDEKEGVGASSALWLINASLSQVSRDPEPLLSILVRPRRE
ncbi:MAG TPA: hypothetical protein VGY54_18095 [Polyangiaceae bacterium]|nr:hypothetical protein [Polyangiaceae bacterium]